MDSDILDTSDAKALPVAELLRRVALELRDLVQTVDGLQLLVGDLAPRGAGCDASVVKRLQDFDRLGQTLSGVADFSEALGSAAPDHWRLNPHPASRIVLLADLAARLASRERAPSAAAGVVGEF
jgi:hypothetical protein